MSPWLSDLYLRSQSDARLVSLARDGHDRAFAVLAERYRTELLGQARRLSGAGNAEDLVQQTLLSAFAALRRGAEVGHARGWLHAILRHAAIRAHAPIEAPLETALGALVAHDTLLETRADARELLSALDELPARQREALVGSAMQGLSRAELAASLGVSEGAVRQLVHRARMAVRAAVTAITPYQLARSLSDSASSGGSTSELALGGGAAAGAGGVLAKVGMVAAAGAIAAGGAVVAEHHAARVGRPHRATVTVATSRLHAAGSATAASAAMIGATGTRAAARHGTTGARTLTSNDGRGASGQMRLGPGSGEGRGSGGDGGRRSVTSLGSGSPDGGGDRSAGQSGGSDGGSGSAAQTTGSQAGRSGSGSSDDGSPSAVPASAPATSGTSGDGTGGPLVATSGVDGSSGSGDSGSSGGSGGSTTTTTVTGSTGTSGSSADAGSGDGGTTSTN